MLSNVLKKIIIFFIPFFIINNIYAAEGLSVVYNYKTNDAEYIVTIKYSNYGFVEEQTVSKMDSNSASVSKPVDIIPLKNLLGEGDQMFANYGITDCEISSNNYKYDMQLESGNADSFFNALKENPEKFRPILRIDKSGNAVLIGSYFSADSFVETYEKSNNLNDYDSTVIEMLLNGKLTPIAGAFEVERLYLYERLGIDESGIASYVGSNTNSIDSGDKKNESYTDGTCDKYTMVLRNLNEKIFGRNNTAGVCSENSLKILKDTQSLYDLKYNFDRSILESECSDYIFGDNGYLNTIIKSQSYYNSISDEDITKMSLSCLGMQTEYLKGISALTVYEPIVKVDKSECELINSETLDFLNSLFDAIKLIATCICIFLCVTDVYKIVITKESDVTKFRKVLVKRVVALVFLFLTPVIVNIITDLLNERYLQSNPIKCADILNSR